MRQWCQFRNIILIFLEGGFNDSLFIRGLRLGKTQQRFSADEHRCKNVRERKEPMEILYNGTPCSYTPRSGYTQLTGLCTKEATIRVCRIRRCALQPSTEITGPSLRKKFYVVFFSVRIYRRARLRSPRGNGREERARRGSSGLWRSRKSICSLRPVHAVLFLSVSPSRLTPGLSPRSHGQAVAERKECSRSRGDCSAGALRLQKLVAKAGCQAQGSAAELERGEAKRCRTIS